MVYRYRFLVLFVIFILGLIGIFVFQTTQAIDVTTTVISFSEDTKSIQLNSPFEKIAYIKLEAVFDPSIIVLSGEISPSSFFDNVIYVTDEKEANETGRIKLILALSPTAIKNARTGNFELAKLDFISRKLQESKSTSIKFENIQLVNTDAREINFFTIPGEFSTFTAKPDPVGTGLIGNYYNGVNFNQVIFRRVDPNINFDWHFGSPGNKLGGNKFSIRWRGFFYAESDGNYTFYVNADDGNKLWIKDKLIIDSWRNKQAKEEYGNITLEKGKYYPINLEYYENNGRAQIQLLYSTQNISKRIIPASLLFP